MYIIYPSSHDLHCIALAIIVDSDIRLSSVTGLSDVPRAIISIVTLGLLL